MELMKELEAVLPPPSNLLTIVGANTLLSHILSTTVCKHPASLPVSLSRQHLPLLRRGYCVGHKADGVRSFVIFDKTAMYIYRRSGQFRRVQTRDYALADGVTVLDIELMSNGTALVFDVLVYNGRSTTMTCYTSRVEIIRLFLATVGKATREPIPRPFLQSNYVNSEYQCGGITFFAKPVALHKYTQYVWQNRPEECDGLVFTRLRSPYVPFADKTLFKWKETITVDFRVASRLPKDTLTPIEGVWTKFRVPEGSKTLLTTPPSCAKQILFSFCDCDVPVGAIAEFSFIGNKWELMAIRDDKSKPNHLNTVKDSCKNIVQNITIKEL